MGICQQTVKLNGIIDNQSSYEIIYHVSGSMKQLTDYEEELNLGPKFGVGMQGVQMQGINYNKKRMCKNEKYHSVARIPKHSFCSVGLNDIEVGCFLSIYATKLNQQGNQVYKKLIFKDICIRTNEDICLRINKDLTLKQLTPNEITQLKKYFEKQKSAIVSTFKQKSEKLQSESAGQQPVNRLLVSTQYVRKMFGLPSPRYIRFDSTGFYDLNHIGVKIQFGEFLRYDWVYLQSLQLDNCQIDDSGWFTFCSGAQYYFPNLKNIYLADNKINTILQGDLEHFPSLKILQLDYSETQGTNPLNEQSKKVIFYFALQHPDVLIYCASIDETKYMDLSCDYEEFIQEIKNPQKSQNQQFSTKYPDPNKMQWFLFFPPSVNSTREQNESIKKSKIETKKKQKNVISKPNLQKLKQRLSEK